jgi:uncharacterized protein
MNGPSFRVRVEPSIRSIPAALWDACARGGPVQFTRTSADKGLDGPEKIPRVEPVCEDDPDNPFITHDFLASLEESGAATPRTGWLGRHLVVEDEAGATLAAMPAYLKSHSRGEYVFDHGWADAYERAGGSYYPKLQVSVPFTPVTGPRLLVCDGPSASAAREALIAGALELVKRERASSLHITFATEPEWNYLVSLGFLARNDRQFHWLNEGYRSFDEFLAELSSRRRKMIKRERREALAGGVEIDRLTGADLTEDTWDAFFAFYMDTGSRKWGSPYLNRTFFSIVGEKMRDRIVLIMARRRGRFIAGALNFLGKHTIYGRYWGSIEHRRFLHFEVCYYQAIEFAIERGLKVVEAGAQGAHKIPRGYRPVITRSAHYIAHPSLRRAVADYLKTERAYVAAEAAELAGALPFRGEEAEF